MTNRFSLAAPLCLIPLPVALHFGKKRQCQYGYIQFESRQPRFVHIRLDRDLKNTKAKNRDFNAIVQFYSLHNSLLIICHLGRESNNWSRLQVKGFTVYSQVSNLSDPRPNLHY
jgi:hypothetical protein